MTHPTEVPPKKEEPAASADGKLEPQPYNQAEQAESNPNDADRTDTRRQTFTNLERRLGKHGLWLLQVSTWQDQFFPLAATPSRRLGRQTGLTREELLFVLDYHWSHVHPRRPWP
jgi:hypothetical protein